MLQLLFLLACPLLVAAGVTVLSSNALSSPWKFLALCSLALCALYAAAFYWLAPSSVGFAVQASGLESTLADEPLFVFLAPYTKPLLAFALGSVPIVFGLHRLLKR
jgi:hypothetical protein